MRRRFSILIGSSNARDGGGNEPDPPRSPSHTVSMPVVPLYTSQDENTDTARETPVRSHSSGEVPLPDTASTLVSRPSTGMATEFQPPIFPQPDRARLRTWMSTVTADRRQTSPASDTGLRLVHDAQDATGDLILVHGLGGSSVTSWSWNRDPQFFWPTWLASDELLGNLRVFTFGYNANFKGPKSPLGILDFAKDLLFAMSGVADKGSKIGDKPIIFVAHSMGGLVVKKAYILGMLDDTYASMMSNVFGIVFLSTPHKGSDLAHTLNNILSVSPIASAKVYIAELGAQSPTLKDINEQFRLVCKRLHLVSFYETLSTWAGTGRKMIVDGDSGVLGYPTETSAPMMADHHNVCKYSSIDDPNFIALRNILRDWAVKSKPQEYLCSAANSQHAEQHEAHDAFAKVTQSLGINDVTALDKFQQIEGSCLWVQEEADFTNWAKPTTSNLETLWLTGLPGTGKSTLAKSIINYLKAPERDPLLCHYHFFSFADTSKRTISYGLRSIAFQLAQDNSAFCSQLLQAYDKTGIAFAQQDAQVIWSRIFQGILFKMDLSTPLYWVLDGLDEADNPASLVSTILDSRPRFPLRILLLSRLSPNLINLATSNRPQLTHFQLKQRDTEADIRLFIHRRIHDTLPIADDMKEYVSLQMFAKASGSFLWARLALDTLQHNWHTAEDIDRALNDIPQGMQSLFERMLQTIKSLRVNSERNYALARRILSWATCSAEPLSTAELASALEGEFSKLQNLEATILHLCGHFLIIVDGKIMPIHETAKSFLLSAHEDDEPFLVRRECHEHLARVCIEYLCSNAWKAFLLEVEEAEHWSPLVSQNRWSLFLAQNPFCRYAISHWAYHVRHSDFKSPGLLPLLQAFFDEHILSWIHGCVVLRGLRGIVQTARHIKAFSQNWKTRSRSATFIDLGFKSDDGAFFQGWSVDLFRVVGRFGSNLSQKPSAIYRIIPPLCPRGSMVYKTYSTLSSLSVQGISSEAWDDCLARLPIGDDRSIYRVLSTVTYFVCLIAAGGEIIVCLAETFEEARRMRHGEYVAHMAVNQSGSLLATAGFDTFRVWDLSTGEQVYQIPKPTSALTMTIGFGAVDNELVVGYDDCMVVCYDMEKRTVLWDFLAEENDDNDYAACPRGMALSPNSTKIAVVNHKRPVLVWDLSTRERRPLKCVRASERDNENDDSPDQLDSMHWCPDGLSVFVLYDDSLIVRYFLTDEEALEVGDTGAREMAISPDGNLVLTSDTAGTLSLWTLPKFHLVYRLPHEEFVRDITFSPDSQRFYDARGTICHVWEPAVLLKEEDDPDDSSTSERSSEFSGPDFVVSEDNTLRSQVTALAYGPLKDYYLCGRDDGSVSIHDISDGGGGSGRKRTRKAYSHDSMAAVVALAWAPTAKYVASCDDSGRIIAKRLEMKVEDDNSIKWSVFPCLDLSETELVNQFVFHPGQRLLLLSFPSSDRLWNLKTKTEVWRRDRGRSLGFDVHWLSHPLQKNLLLCVRHDGTTVHDWSLSGCEQESHLQAVMQLKSQHPQSNAPRVNRVAVSEDRRHILIEILPSSSPHKRTKSSKKELQLHLLRTDTLSASSSHNNSILADPLPATIAHSVGALLGCVKGQLVFLDHEYWVCTVPIPSTPAPPATTTTRSATSSTLTKARPPSSTTVTTAAAASKTAPPKKHFFLPRDCVGPSSLPLVTLAAGGAVLFPKNGEVGVVREGLLL